MRKAIFTILITLLIYQPAFATTEDLVISEIMYDVPGSDKGHEWVEIYNSGDAFIALIEAWRFWDGSNHTVRLEQGTTTITASEYFILADNAEQFLLTYPDFSGTVFDTVISLSNSSSSLALNFADSSIKASYDSSWGANGNGFSLEKIDLSHDSAAENWQESNIEGGTPGLANSEVVEVEILAPLVSIVCPDSLFVNELGTFDASSSSDPQDLELNFLWDIDNTTTTSSIVEYSFTEVGNYIINLSISNGQLEDSTSCNVEVIAEEINHWEDILISEFLPNPVGSDDIEWIELYNSGEELINLSGFALQDNTTRVFTLEEYSLEPDQYLVIYKNVSKISLNNSNGDAVKLYNPDGELLEIVEYDRALEGRSYARSNDFWQWTKQPTPGGANILLANQAPIAKISIESDELIVNKKISFSAAESYDPEEDDLDYQWNFGDNSTDDGKTTKHVFSSVGSYIIKLLVTDKEGAQAEASVSIYINAEVNEEETVEVIDIKPIDFNKENLIISEFMSNPVGSDDMEWIEIYNSSDKEIDLTGWRLDDQEGGSKPYIFPANSNIVSSEFLVISREESKLSLNNSGDAVRLLTPLEDLWQEVVYETIPEGQSQAWDFVNHEWFINQTPSPGAINLYIEVQSIVYSLAEANELAKGDEPIVQGVALHNSDSKNRSLYLADWDGQSILYDQTIEIYSYYKDWPEIKQGDLLEIKGEVSKVGRLKISSAEDITKIAEGIEIIKPEAITLDELDEDLVNSLTTVKGIIVRKSGKSVYLANEEEEEYQLRVYLNFDTKDLELKKGVEMIATGMLSETAKGFKLTPFKKRDILLSKIVLGAKEETEAEELNIANTSTNSNFFVERQDQVKNVLFFVIVAAIIVGIIYYLKHKKKNSIN